MKRTRMAILMIALSAAVFTSLNSFRQTGCWYSQQYYKVGSSYIPAGQMGVDYDCWQSFNTCTYYRPNPVLQPNLYVACQQGAYTVIPK